MTERVATSMRELQEQAGDIIQRIHADPTLAVAALANPLRALTELGYRLDLELRDAVEDRSRFGASDQKQRRRLRERIFEAAGRPVDLSSPKDLRKLLFEELGLCGEDESEPDVAPLPPHPGKKDAPEDPLDTLGDRHPILKPLREYRRLDTRAPAFASRTDYERLRRGEMRLPKIHIRARPAERRQEE